MRRRWPGGRGTQSRARKRSPRFLFRLLLEDMGSFRFRRTISLGRFLRWNVAKTGTSVSVGRPGATINVRKDRVDGTVGVPGTGLSYRERLSNRGCASVLVVAALAGAAWRWFA